MTHMYLDHPQEPSPEERGFYWGTRYTDAFKTFSFMPDDYYMNADIKRSGEPITLAEICGKNNLGCPPLNKSENILGKILNFTLMTIVLFIYIIYIHESSFNLRCLKYSLSINIELIGLSDPADVDFVNMMFDLI